jgi:hypothetical protein
MRAKLSTQMKRKLLGMDMHPPKHVKVQERKSPRRGVVRSKVSWSCIPGDFNALYKGTCSCAWDEICVSFGQQVPSET